MINVSESFQDSVYAPTRVTDARVFLELFEDIKDESTPTTSSQLPISRGLEQINNGVRFNTHRYATFEHNYFKLDGKTHIAPTSNLDEKDWEIGWVSANLSDENGKYGMLPWIEFAFKEPVSSSGITVHFDTEVYAEDFSIRVHFADGTSKTSTIKGNTHSSYSHKDNLVDYNKVRIIFNKTSKPYRYIRVAEVDFGIIEEYYSDDLIEVDILEEMTVLSSEVPSNELSFTIHNKEKEFNILNPVGYYRHLKDRQRVLVSLGVQLPDESIEYVPSGVFYLTEWQSDEGALTTSFKARDILEIIEKDEYKNSLKDTNLYDLAIDVLTKSNIEYYDIDENLKQYNTKGFYETLNSRDALQNIAMASKSAIFQDRNGVLVIKQFDTLDKTDSKYVNFIGDSIFAGEIRTEVLEDYSMKNITFDNIYGEPQIHLEDLLYSVVVEVTKGKDEKEEYTFYSSNKEGISLKLENALINTEEHAKEIADWIIAEYELRAIYNIDWRQNPALETGDIVIVEDSYGEKRLSRITKQEYRFDGALSGYTESKGGV